VLIYHLTLFNSIGRDLTTKGYSFCPHSSQQGEKMKVASKREEKQLIIITRITNTGLFYTRREHIMSTSPAVCTVLSSLSQDLAFTLYTTFLIYIKHVEED